MDKNQDHIIHQRDSKANANALENEEVQYSTEWEMPPSLQFAKEEGEESVDEDTKGAAFQLKENTSQEFKVAPSNFENLSSTPQLSTIQRAPDLDEETEEETNQLKEGLEISAMGDDGPNDNGEDNLSNANSVKQFDDGPIHNQESSADNQNAIPEELMNKMEETIGTNLSNVNIHTESSKAKDVGALAYTQGEDIYFAPNQFNPDTISGQELIAHEMTHVKQQRDGRVQPTTESNGMPVNDSPDLETEADEVGSKAVQMKTNKSSEKSDFTKLNPNVEQNKNEPILNSSSSIVQKDEPTISGGTTAITYTEETYDLSGSYRSVKDQLAGPEEDGSITSSIGEMSYSGESGSDQITVTIPVTIVKRMPNWTDFPAIQELAEDESLSPQQRAYYQRIVEVWNAFIASLDAHENEHLRIDRAGYTDIHTQLTDLTWEAALTRLDELEEAIDQQHEDFHDTDAAEVYTLPYIQRPAERRASGDEREEDEVQYKMENIDSTNNLEKSSSPAQLQTDQTHIPSTQNNEAHWPPHSRYNLSFTTIQKDEEGDNKEKDEFPVNEVEIPLPMDNDQKVKVTLNPMTGGEFSYSAAKFPPGKGPNMMNKPSEGGWKKKMPPLTIPYGPVGLIATAEVGAELNVGLKGAFSVGTFIVPPFLEEGRKATLSGAADLTAKAEGEIGLGIYAGASVANIAAQGYLNITGSVGTTIGISGSAEWNPDGDMIYGAITLDVSMKAAVEASGGVKLTYYTPIDDGTIAKFELAKAPLGSIEIPIKAGIDLISGQQIGSCDIKTEAMKLDLPQFEKTGTITREKWNQMMGGSRAGGTGSPGSSYDDEHGQGGNPNPGNTGTGGNTGQYKLKENSNSQATSIKTIQKKDKHGVSQLKEEVVQRNGEGPSARLRFPFDLGDAETKAEAIILLYRLKGLFQDLKSTITNSEHYTGNPQILADSIQAIQSAITGLNTGDLADPIEGGQAAIIQLFMNGWEETYNTDFHGIRRAIQSHLRSIQNTNTMDDNSPEIREAKRVAFENGDEDTLENLKQITDSIKDYNEKVVSYIERAGQIFSAVRNSETLQGIKEYAGRIAGLAEKAGQVLEAMSIVADLIDGDSNSELHRDINRVQRQLDLINFGLTFVKGVPVLGALWSNYYYPVATRCLTLLGHIATRRNRDRRLMQWIMSNWTSATPPRIRTGLDVAFHGGQSVFSFLWHVFFGNYRFSSGAENYFMNHESEFNAGCDIDMVVTGKWNPFVDNHIQGLQDWSWYNRENIWYMLYGADLPFPGNASVSQDISVSGNAGQRKEVDASSNLGQKSNAIQKQNDNHISSDISRVNIHTDSNKATEVNALAYTEDQDIHFAPGQYNPNSQEGLELIGHELEHVTQQSQGKVKPTSDVNGTPINDEPKLEKEADDAGKKFAQEKTSQLKGDPQISEDTQNLERVIENETPESLPSDLVAQASFGMDHNFNDTKLYKGQEAKETTEDMGVKALAYGKNIIANDTNDHIMMHEMVHIKQQDGRTPSIQAKLVTGKEGGEAEIEANDAAAKILTGQKVDVSQKAPAIRGFGATADEDDKLREGVNHENQTRSAAESEEVGFEPEDAAMIYSGNWQRDLNQLLLPIANRLSSAIYGVLSIAHTKHFGFPLPSPEEFGTYDPVEHIDNPGGLNGESAYDQSNDSYLISAGDTMGGEDESLSELDPRYEETARENEGQLLNPEDSFAFQVDQSALPVYLRTSRTHIINHLQNALDPTAPDPTNPDAANEPMARDRRLRLIGEALHTMQDYYAHSNFCEIAINILLNEPESRAALEQSGLEIGEYNLNSYVHGFDENGRVIQNNETHAGREVMATGTFLFTDTVHSLKEKLNGLLQELNPFEESTVGQPSEWVVAVANWMEQNPEFFTAVDISFISDAFSTLNDILSPILSTAGEVTSGAGELLSDGASSLGGFIAGGLEGIGADGAADFVEGAADSASESIESTLGGYTQEIQEIQKELDKYDKTLSDNAADGTLISYLYVLAYNALSPFLRLSTYVRAIPLIGDDIANKVEEWENKLRAKAIVVLNEKWNEAREKIIEEFNHIADAAVGSTEVTNRSHSATAFTQPTHTDIAKDFDPESASDHGHDDEDDEHEEHQHRHGGAWLAHLADFMARAASTAILRTLRPMLDDPNRYAPDYIRDIILEWFTHPEDCRDKWIEHFTSVLSSQDEDSTEIRNIISERTGRPPTEQAPSDYQTATGYTETAPDVNNQFYAHGSFMGAGVAMMANPKWNYILEVLMPEVHSDVTAALNDGNSSSDVIIMFENNPVTAAFGLVRTQSMDQAGENGRSNRIEQMQAFEWDAFLDPRLVERFTNSSDASQKASIAVDLVDEMVIAHGNQQQTIMENVADRRQYDNVRNTRVSDQGGVTPGTWMDIFGRAMLIGNASDYKAKAKAINSGARVDNESDQSTDTSFEDQMGFQQVINIYRDLYDKEYFSVILDVKSRDATPEVITAMIHELNNRGVHVYGVGSFNSGEIEGLSSVSQEIDGEAAPNAREILFFHSAGDLQSACLEGNIEPGDTVMFNAGSLISYNRFTLGTYQKESYEINQTVVNQLAIYKTRFGFQLGVYVQENRIDDRAATLITELTNNRPDIFDLGFAWGGLSGATAADIEPSIGRSATGMGGQEWVGSDWDTSAQLKSESQTLQKKDDHSNAVIQRTVDPEFTNLILHFYISATATGKSDMVEEDMFDTGQRGKAKQESGEVDLATDKHRYFRVWDFSSIADVAEYLQANESDYTIQQIILSTGHGVEQNGVATWSVGSEDITATDLMLKPIIFPSSHWVSGGSIHNWSCSSGADPKLNFEIQRVLSGLRAAYYASDEEVILMPGTDQTKNPLQDDKKQLEGIEPAQQKPNTNQATHEPSESGSEIPSSVNIHKDSTKASDVGALAYTQGSDIHFAPGQFKPDTKQGKELIGHELKHVEQQAQGKVQPTTQTKGLPVNDDPGLEKEADDFGKEFAQGNPIQKKEINTNSNSNLIQKTPGKSGGFVWHIPLGFGAASTVGGGMRGLLGIGMALANLSHHLKKDEDYEGDTELLSDLVTESAEYYNIFQEDYLESDPIPEEWQDAIVDFGNDAEEIHNEHFSYVKKKVKKGVKNLKVAPKIPEFTAEMAEALREAFEAGADDELDRLQDINGSISEYNENIQGMIDKLKKVSQSLSESKVIEKLEKATGKIGDYTEKAEKVLNVTEDLVTLFNVDGGVPGDTQRNINQFRAQLKLIDVGMTFVKGVPVLGIMWSNYIYPVSMQCLKWLGHIGSQQDKNFRQIFYYDKFKKWRYPTPPRHSSDNPRGFPGGKAVFEFMWHVYFKKDAVTKEAEDYFMKYKDEFNAGAKSSMIITGEWNPIVENHIKDFYYWARNNRAEIWAMLYGSDLPRPGSSHVPGDDPGALKSGGVFQLKLNKEKSANPSQVTQKATNEAEIPSDVNIHEDSTKASEMDALAFTQGSDIHFAPGQFNPDTVEGQELIGHELKHVEQQAEGKLEPSAEINGLPVNENPGLESEADDFGKEYAKGDQKISSETLDESPTDSTIQKKEDPPSSPDTGANNEFGSLLSHDKKYNKANRVAVLHERLSDLQFNCSGIIEAWGNEDTSYSQLFDKCELTYPEYKLYSRQEYSTYSHLSPFLNSGSLQYNTQIWSQVDDYIRNAEILVKALIPFDKHVKEQLKIDRMLYESVYYLQRMLFNVGRSMKDIKDYSALYRDDLLRILQKTFPYRFQRNKLFLKETGMHLWHVIDKNWLIQNNAITKKIVLAYFWHGKLRPVDKFYIAVKGWGTDEGNVNFSLLQASSREGGIDAIEENYRNDYREDFEGESWLPHAGYKNKSWKIAGRMKGDLSGWDLFKARCLLSFGQIRTVDRLAWAIEDNKSEQKILDLVAEVQAKDKIPNLKKYLKDLWGHDLEGHLKWKNENRIRTNAHNDSGIMGSNYNHEEVTKKIKEENKQTSDKLNAALGIKGSKLEKWLQAVRTHRKKLALELYMSMDEWTKVQALGYLDPVLVGGAKQDIFLFPWEKEEYISLFAVGQTQAYEVLRNADALDKESISSFLKYRATGREYKILSDGYSFSNPTFYKFLIDLKLDKEIYRALATTKIGVLIYVIAEKKDINWATHWITEVLSDDEIKYIKTNVWNYKKTLAKNIKDKNFKRQVFGLLNRNFEERVAVERDKLDEENTGLGADVTNAFSTSGLSAENEQRELEVSLEMARFNDGRIDEDEEEALNEGIENARVTRENFISTRNTVEGIATMVVNIAIAIIASPLIPGASLKIAGSILRSAAIQGGANILTNKLVQGSRYKSKNILSDFTRGAIDGMMGYLGPLAISRKFPNMKTWLGRTILEEVASDVHNLGYELVTKPDLDAFRNHVINVIVGTGVSGTTEKLSQLLNSPIIDSPSDSPTGPASHIDPDAAGTKPDESGKTDESNKADEETDNQQHTDPSLVALHGKNPNAKTEEAIKTEEAEIDQELLSFIKTAGSWDKAIAMAKETPISGKLIPALEKLRKKIADSVKSGSTLKGSSIGPDSDVDVNINGDNAGSILIEEHGRLIREVGDYERLLKMSLFTDKSRLSKHLEAEGSISEAKYKKLKRGINRRAEQYLLARRLRNAKNNPKELERIESQLKGRKDEKYIRNLSEKDPKKMQEKIEENHKEIDRLLIKLKNPHLKPSQRAMYMERVSKKQMENNFYSNEAYIGSSTMKFLDPDDLDIMSPDDVHIVLQDQLAFIGAKISEYGSASKAAIGPEVYKYQARFVEALEEAGIPVSEELKMYKELAIAISRKLEGESVSLLGRDFNIKKPGSSTPEMQASRARVLNQFMDLAQKEINNLDLQGITGNQLKKIKSSTKKKSEGSSAKSKNQNDSSSNVNESGPNDTASGATIVDRSEKGARFGGFDKYFVHDSSNSKLNAVGTLDGEGLSITIRSKDKDTEQVSDVIVGHEQYRKIVSFFEGQFKYIKGSWQYGTNLKKVNELTKYSDITLEEAITKTWSARQARDLGYGEAELVDKKGTPGAYTLVQVKFHPSSQTSIKPKVEPEDPEKEKEKRANRPTAPMKAVKPPKDDDVGQKKSATQTNSVIPDTRSQIDVSTFELVNIHQDSTVPVEMGALAYTLGNDIYFAPGQFNPYTTEGQELIGHELKHVEQQAAGKVKPTREENGSPINDDPILEKEADEYGKVYADQLKGSKTDNGIENGFILHDINENGNQSLTYNNGLQVPEYKIHSDGSPPEENSGKMKKSKPYPFEETEFSFLKSDTFIQADYILGSNSTSTLENDLTEDENGNSFNEIKPFMLAIDAEDQDPEK